MLKRISLLLICIMLLTAVCACRKDNPKIKETDQVTEDNNDINNNKNNNQVATGRYVEEELQLPEGILATEYAGLAIAPDGIPELYVNHNGTYEKYKYIDQKWNKEDAGGLSAFNNYAGNFILTDVIYGEDGKQYLIGDTTEYHSALYRLTDQGEYEKIPISKFDEIFEEWKVPLRANLIKVLENGMIAVLFQMGEIVIYTPDGKSVAEELNSSYSGKMAAEGNVLYYTNESENELVGINLETGEEEATGTIEIESTNTGIMEISLLEIDKGSVFLCDKNGIQVYQLEGSIWETIVEGSQSSLSMPSLTLNKFLIGSQEDYYFVQRSEQSSSIKHIFYDNNALSVAPTELSIFSLEDNKTIRQAVSTFSANHPEVKLTYRVAKQDQKVKETYGIKNSKQTIPDSDYINALNTELLADRGADILVLDGLSYSSYIEKGVLEDMGDLFQPMIESGELLPNIAVNYLADGKVYVMPARIKVPVIYGKTEAVNASDSLKSLVEYAENSNEPLLDPSNYRALAAWCFLLYYDQLVNEDNEIDEALLQAFLENIQIISENIKASDQASLSGKNYASGLIYGGYWVSSDINVYKKTVQANMEVLGEFDDFAIPLTVTAQWSGDYKIVNKTYEENTLVGINSAGKNKELGKEFMQLLFSEELQSLSGMDGFPMNSKAMENMAQSTKLGAITYGSQDFKIQCDFPAPEVKGRIAEEIRGLSHPVANDTTLLNMILDEAERYLRGDITAEQAANNAVGSINTYLNE